MCTAISLPASDHYFGRNLDFEHSFGEKITLTPRRFPFHGEKKEHYAMIGTALPLHNSPLYFDATNEAGLSMAGLLFPGTAHYFPPTPGKENIASYQLIPHILGQCKTVSEARRLLEQINITDESFSPELPPSPLHWLLADKDQTLTLEQTTSGLTVYENPVGVLTNNPTFDMQLLTLQNYAALTTHSPKTLFSGSLDYVPYSKGLGALGLPGDLSSMSRFARACFTKLHAVFEDSEEKKVTQFFHVLQSVSQTKGCVRTPDGYEKTIYASCCNTSRGIYYYRTYYNSHIYGIDMHREDLDSKTIKIFPMTDAEPLTIQN